MSIDLYLMNLSPACRSVRMVAKHLNIELNLIPIDVSKGEHLTPEYLKINPAHTVPTIVDDGFVLWESRAIIQYLCNKYAPESDLYPSDPYERAQVDRNLNFDMSYYTSIHEAIALPSYHGYEPSEEKITKMKNNIKLLDTIIGENKYVTGDNLTIADLSLLATSEIFNIMEEDLTEYPNLKSWLESLSTELPYYDEINGNLKEDVKAFMDKIKKDKEEDK